MKQRVNIKQFIMNTITEAFAIVQQLINDNNWKNTRPIKFFWNIHDYVRLSGSDESLY